MQTSHESGKGKPGGKSERGLISVLCWLQEYLFSLKDAVDRAGKPHAHLRKRQRQNYTALEFFPVQGMVKRTRFGGRIKGAAGFGGIVVPERRRGRVL